MWAQLVGLNTNVLSQHGWDLLLLTLIRSFRLVDSKSLLPRGTEVFFLPPSFFSSRFWCSWFVVYNAWPLAQFEMWHLEVSGWCGCHISPLTYCGVLSQRFYTTCWTEQRDISEKYCHEPGKRPQIMVRDCCWNFDLGVKHLLVKWIVHRIASRRSVRTDDTSDFVCVGGAGDSQTTNLESNQSD